MRPAETPLPSPVLASRTELISPVLLAPEHAPSGAWQDTHAPACTPEPHLKESYRRVRSHVVIRLPVPVLSGCSSVGVDNTLDRSAPIARRPLSGIEPRPMLLGVNRSKGMLLLGLRVILSNLLPLLSFRSVRSGLE